MIKVVSLKMCPFVQHVVALLEAKNIPYEVDYISLSNKPQWFLDISPTGQVPVLIAEDGTPLFESDAIVEYLDEISDPVEANVSPEQTNPNYTSFSSIGGSKEETKLNLKNLEKIKKVKFAFGLSRGGKHTWLFSEGKVYEVHWDSIGSGLYEATKLEDFQWLSGAIIVPPDAYTAADFDQRDFWDDVTKFLKGIFD